MTKFERITPVLWLVLALVLVGQFPLDKAPVAVEPVAMDSGESRAILDDSSNDADFDGLVHGVGVPAGTGIRSVYGHSGRSCGGGIACVIPDATGPPGREA